MNQEIKEQILQPVTSAEKPLEATLADISTISMPARLMVLCVSLSFLGAACRDSRLKAQISELEGEIATLKEYKASKVELEKITGKVKALEKIAKETKESKKSPFIRNLEEQEKEKEKLDESSRMHKIEDAFGYGEYEPGYTNYDVDQINDFLQKIFKQFFAKDAFNDRNKAITKNGKRIKAVNTYEYWTEDAGLNEKTGNELFELIERSMENLDQIVADFIKVTKKLPKNMRADVIVSFITLSALLEKAERLYPKYEDLLLLGEETPDANLNVLQEEYNQLGDDDKLLQSTIGLVHKLKQKKLLEETNAGVEKILKALVVK